MLSHADAKTRKNAALLLGDLSDRVQALELAGQVTQALWAAYEREDTKFVLASYIKGLSAYDCGEILESLQAERKRLGAEEIGKKTKNICVFCWSRWIFCWRHTRRRKTTGIRVSTINML